MDNKMPGMPSFENKEGVSSTSLSSPESEAALSKDGAASQEKNEEKQDLDKRPELDSPDNKSQSNVNVMENPKNGIKVKAIRAGFFKQKRIREGDEFTIKNFDQVGEWMRCLDKELEKKRVKFYEDKKARK